MDGPPENDFCSICHANFHLPSQANCSHWYCSNCILQVWNHGPALQPCKCPLCRRPITLLIPSESTSRQLDNAEVSEILQRIQSYNRVFGERSEGLVQRVQDLPFLLRRLLRDIMDPQRSIPLVIRARVYLAAFLSAIYVLSPIDIIPEGLAVRSRFVNDVVSEDLIHCYF
ncbi:OLC1v1013095C4 [Oldenlandia corymbosa var. corymbosa]|uniref:OLC1v1013095C4 n=1 Tax=Oldenlandia corymbosa var. corymbosa TaxID=529605 RepID=A0AAV1DZF0_OLDCO|nr:OLC1v1013095C4 [Oldenlandia corymbosa var. corymbosa]